MSPIRVLSELALTPAVARPGDRVLLTAFLHVEAPAPQLLVAQLYDASGELTSEADLAVGIDKAEGVLIIPERAREGPCEVVLRVPEWGQIETSLLVLSPNTEQAVASAGAADDLRLLASQQLPQQQPDDTLRLLEQAEHTYRAAGWWHSVIDTLLERADLVQRTSLGEARALRVSALALLNRRGLVCRAGESWGRARFYFDRAKRLALELDVPKEVAINSNNLGEVLLYLRSVDDRFIGYAIENFDSALRYATTTPDLQIEATARENLASAYALLGRLSNTMTELMNTRAILETLGTDNDRQRIRQKIDAVSALLTSNPPGPITIGPRLPVLNDILRDIVDRMRPTAREHDIELSLQLPTNLPTPAVDLQQFTRVIVSMLTNAIQFQSPRDTLVLAARAQAKGGRDGIRVELQGMSRGLSQEVIERVFEPFVPDHEQSVAAIAFWVPSLS